MTTLNDIVVASGPRLPIIGRNGYGGEQDGSRVVLLGPYYPGTRANMKKVTVGPAIELHWARYDYVNGWEVVLGHWSDRDESEVWIKDPEGALQ